MEDNVFTLEVRRLQKFFEEREQYLDSTTLGQLAISNLRTFGVEDDNSPPKEGYEGHGGSID